jgi:hypothetical protein
MFEVSGPHFAWIPIWTEDHGTIWLKRYWTSGLSTNFHEHRNAIRGRSVSVTSLGREANAWVRVSDWRFERYRIVRTYEFSGLPPPETTTRLEIELLVRKAPSGYVHTSLAFHLRPYIYLTCNRSSLSDRVGRSLFNVGFYGGTGRGTEESPMLLGTGFTTEAEQHGDEDAAMFEINEPRDIKLCMKAISSGDNITFSVIKEDERPIKLRLELPNDQEKLFMTLYQQLEALPE